MVVVYDSVTLGVVYLALDGGLGSSYASQGYGAPHVQTAPGAIPNVAEQRRLFVSGVPYRVNQHPNPTALVRLPLPEYIDLSYGYDGPPLSAVDQVYLQTTGPNSLIAGYYQRRATNVVEVSIQADAADHALLEVVRDPSGAAIVAAAFELGTDPAPLAAGAATATTTPALTGSLSLPAGSTIALRVRDPNGVGLAWSNVTAVVRIRPA